MADNESPLGGPLELPGGEQQHARSHPKSSGRIRRMIKKLLIILLVLTLLTAFGFGGRKLLNNKKTTKAVDQPNTSSQTSPSPAPKISDLPAAAGTKSFKSSSLGVELAYPAGWTATEADGGIRIDSPEFNYTTVDKGTVSGNFRVYIRKGAREVDSKYIGRGVATQPSEKLVYSQPTSTQRKETNLSFFGLDSGDQFAFFLVAGNFNLKKGDTLGPNYGKETDTFIVTGGYSSKTLTDDFATNQIPLGTFQQTNAYKQALDILKSLKLN